MTTAAASVADVQPSRVGAPGVKRALTTGQAAVVALSVMLGLVVAGYGFAGSYVTVPALAARQGVPLAGLVPAGINGGLVAVVVLDLVLAWIGTPVAWLRQLVRVQSVGTVAANAAGGWPSPIAVGLHSAAPVMLLAMVEVGRTVLLRRMGHANGTLRDPVLLARWLLAPWRTWLLWRRMVLWRITSYRQAVEAELELRCAVALLRTRYGRRWRRRAPTDLVWMLRTGTHVEEAYERVVAEVPTRGSASIESSMPVVRPSSGVSADAVRDANLCCTDGLPLRIEPADRERFDDAVRLDREHWAQSGRPISAETLRKRLRLGAVKSRAWCRAIRAGDRDAVCGADRP